VPVALALSMSVISILALTAVAIWRPAQVKRVGVQVVALLVISGLVSVVSEPVAKVVLVAGCCTFVGAYQKEKRLTRAGAVVAGAVGVCVIVLYPASWTLAISFLFGWANAVGQLGGENAPAGGGGKRDATDLLPAAVFILLGVGVAEVSADAALLILFSVLAFVANDVLASDLGPIIPGQAHLLPHLASVPHGTPGAVSYAGTLIGLVGSLSAAVCAGILLSSLVLGGWVLLAGTVGAVVDTALSRSRMRSAMARGRELINFIGCSSAVCVGLLGLLWEG